ncbi:hypothetical protein UACE39S_05140 [Ureibacillus acetophenoni]
MKSEPFLYENNPNFIELGAYRGDLIGEETKSVNILHQENKSQRIARELGISELLKNISIS